MSSKEKRREREIKRKRNFCEMTTTQAWMGITMSIVWSHSALSLQGRSMVTTGEEQVDL